jgi:hypothetical protein
MMASTPWDWQACITRSSSVATTTRLADESLARCATRTTIGIPAKSAKGLSGRREDAILAGIKTVKVMGKSL